MCYMYILLKIDQEIEKSKTSLREKQQIFAKTVWFVLLYGIVQRSPGPQRKSFYLVCPDVIQFSSKNFHDKEIYRDSTSEDIV